MISFRSSITQQLLNYFFTNKHEKRYVNELAKILEVDPKNLDNKLKEIEKEGLLKSEWQGKQRYYSLNQVYPLFKEYEQIFLKTFGLNNFFRKSLEKFHGIVAVYIFGSYANDQFNVSSDIDLLIIGSHKALEAQKAVLKLQKQLNREINIIDMTKKEFEQRKKQNDPFIKEIFDKPIIKVI